MRKIVVLTGTCPGWIGRAWPEPARFTPAELREALGKVGSGTGSPLRITGVPPVIVMAGTPLDRDRSAMPRGLPVQSCLRSETICRKTKELAMNGENLAKMYVIQTKIISRF